MANNNNCLYDRTLGDVFSNEELVANCKEAQGRVATAEKTRHWPGKDRRHDPVHLPVDNSIEPLRDIFNM